MVGARVDYWNPNGCEARMVKLGQFLFISGLLTCLAAGLLAICFIIATFIVNFIRIWKPHFAEYQWPEDAVKKHDHAGVRRVAIDFVIAERIRRVNALRKQFRELQDPLRILITQRKLANDPQIKWSLDEIAGLIQLKPLASQMDSEQYALAKFPHGPTGTAWWLCIKQSVKNKGMRTAFSPLVERRMRMDKASADRWAAQLGPEVFIVPASAAARIAARKQTEEAHA
jgi:hypothetical protein